MRYSCLHGRRLKAKVKDVYCAWGINAAADIQIKITFSDITN